MHVTKVVIHPGKVIITKWIQTAAARVWTAEILSRLTTRAIQSKQSLLETLNLVALQQNGTLLISVMKIIIIIIIQELKMTY